MTDPTQPATEIVVYTRSRGCPYWTLGQRVLDDYALDYRVILIDEDAEAAQRVIEWTGFRAVPTVIAARPGDDLPFEEPAPLPAGESPRGIDRGSMITEANHDQFLAWLARHDFIEEEEVG